MKSNIRQKVDDLVKEGGRYKVICDLYEEANKSVKKQLLDLSDKLDGFQLSKHFKTPTGSFMISEADLKGVDKEKMRDMFDNGEISVDDLFDMASFTLGSVKKKLGEIGEKKLATHTGDVRTTIMIKSTKEYKQSIIDSLPKRKVSTKASTDAKKAVKKKIVSKNKRVYKSR